MNQIILYAFLFFSNVICYSQDLFSGGSNSWIFHTPDDGRTTLHIAPLIDNVYNFGYQTMFDNTGNVVFSGSIGIGSTQLTSQLSIGINHGIKLSVGNSGWANPNIIVTGYNYDVGDYTDIKVAGHAVNNANIRITQYGNVGIGTITPANKLDVNGTIHSKEVKVDMNGWSDFVFKKEYNLPTLDQIERHIAEKGHLENIPSEEEVLKNGINVGEMNAKLLQKIEELTLYMIEMKKENEQMKKENKRITDKQTDLEKQIKHLTK